jgi:hypothetical protein
VLMYTFGLTALPSAFSGLVAFRKYLLM